MYIYICGKHCRFSRQQVENLCKDHTLLSPIYPRFIGSPNLRHHKDLKRGAVLELGLFFVLTTCLIF